MSMVTCCGREVWLTLYCEVHQTDPPYHVVSSTPVHPISVLFMCHLLHCLLPVVIVVATPLILGSSFRVQVMLGTGSPVNPQDKVTLVLGSTFTRVVPSGVAVGGSVHEK